MAVCPGQSAPARQAVQAQAGQEGPSGRALPRRARCQRTTRSAFA